MFVIQTIYDGLVIGMLYAIVGLGVVLIFRTTNVLNFGQGAIATTSGYLSWQLTAGSGLSYVPSIVIAILIGALMGTLLGGIITAFMRSASAFEKSVATLGFSFALAWANRTLFGDQVQAAPKVFEWYTNVGGLTITGMGLYIITISGLALALVFFLLHKTRMGLNMRALSQDSATARSFGISENRTSMAVWFIGSALGALSGVLVGAFLQLDHSVMTTIMIQSFAALVLGGFGSPLGAVVGSLVLGIASSGITTFVDSGFKNTIILLVVLVLLVVRPAGLVGAKEIVVPESGHDRSHPALPTPGSWRKPHMLISGAGLIAAFIVLPFVPHPFSIVTYSVVLSTAIAAVGLGLLMGWVGELSLGHGAFVTVGAYVAALLIARVPGLSFPLTVAMAALGAAVMGAIVGWATLRLSSYYLAVATLFLTYVVTEIILQFDDVTGGPTGVGVALPRIPGLHLATDRDVYYLILVGFVAVAAIVTVLVRSRLGQLWVALRDAPNAAAASGVRVSRRKIAAFAVSAAITGVGGALIAVALSHVGPADFDLHWSIMLILAVIVGGSGSLPGALLGSALVVLVPEALAHTRGMSDLVLGLALMIVIIALPGGAPTVARRLQRFGRKGRDGPPLSGGNRTMGVRDKADTVSDGKVDDA